MDRTVRIILLLIFVVAALVRTVRLGASRRPSSAAVRPSTDTEAPPPAPAAPVTKSPIDAEPGSGAGGVVAVLAAIAVLAAGNAVVWLVLFRLPALEEVPTPWRVAAGVIANLCLIYLARAAATRVGKGADQDPPVGGSPIS